MDGTTIAGTSRTARPRDLSLDAFRGLTVVAMILVNVQGTPPLAYGWLSHAEWNGMTGADLIFPWFLLIVGLSIPLAIDGRAVGAGRIVRRSLLLFVLGVVLALLIRPRFEPEQIRWMGVLQRIGIVYLAAALVARATRGWRVPLLLATGAMAFHALLLLTPAPGTATASLAAGQGMAAWLDQALLPGRLYRTTWDPEGVLSTLSAIASALVGVGVMRRVRDRPRELPLFAAACLVAGIALTVLLPLNKALWTPSFALVTAGLGLALWQAMRWAWHGTGDTAPARLTVGIGQAALTLYVVHMLLLALLVRRLSGETRLWDVAYAPFAATGLPAPAASLAFAGVAAVLCIAVTRALARRGCVLKL